MANDSKIANVVYRPQKHPSQSHQPPEFVVQVNREMYQQWKKDPASVPLVDVVEGGTDVFVNRTGSHTGQLVRSSKQEKHQAFQTEEDVKVVEEILRSGHVVGTNMTAGDSKGFIHP